MEVVRINDGAVLQSWLVVSLARWPADGAHRQILGEIAFPIITLLPVRCDTCIIGGLGAILDLANDTFG